MHLLTSQEVYANLYIYIYIPLGRIFTADIFTMHAQCSNESKFTILLQMGPFDMQITCLTNESYIGFVIVIGYRIVLSIIGCVLALQNRKVNIPELRESKQVGLATYAFLFAVIVEVVLYSAVGDSRTQAILLSLERQAAATLLLLILFVPKVY